MFAQTLLTIVASASLASAAAIELPALHELESRQSSSVGWPGPIGFTYPNIRGWSADTINDGPCGGFSTRNNASDFPVTGGDIVLQQVKDAYHLMLAYSTTANPTSQSDFTPIGNVSHIFTGTSCYDAPDFTEVLSSTAVGSQVTLQLQYIASRYNYTYYQCADLNLVAASGFTPREYTCTNYTRSTQTTAGDNTAISSVLAASNTAELAASASPTSGAETLFSVRGAAAALCAVAVASFTLL